MTKTRCYWAGDDPRMIDRQEQHVPADEHDEREQPASKRPGHLCQ